MVMSRVLAEWIGAGHFDRLVDQFGQDALVVDELDSVVGLPVFEEIISGHAKWGSSLRMRAPAYPPCGRPRSSVALQTLGGSVDRMPKSSTLGEIEAGPGGRP
ncbi:hypothetical protein [Mesorhizobium sp. 1B3]|uniref:hypothetical protein n=1 Tax=Mesorhizobium sp. 1B3 TaxID=3243599 RepID=UPI003D98F847